ncbi:hypothetical protein TRVA0_003S01750 [Trichomonascus vanleenenianus]|uniref:Tco89p n=1 Tax=Trichomonascus vanleenenianus TaxID=2268995 RepID=UPI003ECA57F8
MPNKKKTEEESSGRKKPKQFVAHGRGHTRTTSSTRLNKARMVGPLTGTGEGEDATKFKRSKSSDSLWTKRDRLAPMKSIKSQTRMPAPASSPQLRNHQKPPEAYGFQRYKPADGPILQLDHDEDTEADDSDISSSEGSPRVTAAGKNSTADTVVDDHSDHNSHKEEHNHMEEHDHMEAPRESQLGRVENDVEREEGTKEEDDASTLASEEDTTYHPAITSAPASSASNTGPQVDVEPINGSDKPVGSVESLKSEETLKPDRSTGMVNAPAGPSNASSGPINAPAGPIAPGNAPSNVPTGPIATNNAPIAPDNCPTGPTNGLNGGGLNNGAERNEEPRTPQSQQIAEFSGTQKQQPLRLPSFIRNSPIPPPQISTETVVAVSDPYGSPPPRDGTHRSTPPESELNLKSRFIDSRTPASSSITGEETPQKPGLQRSVSYSTTRTQQKLWLQRESVDHQQASPHYLTPEQRREFERIGKEYLSVLKYSSPLAEAIQRIRVDRVQNSNGPIPLAKRGIRHQYSLSSTSGESALSQSLPKRVNSLSATAVNSLFDSMDRSKSEEESTWHKDSPSLSNSVEAPMNSVTHLMSKLWTEGWQDPDRKQDQPEPQPQPQPQARPMHQHQTPQKFAAATRPGPNGGIRLG